MAEGITKFPFGGNMYGVDAQPLDYEDLQHPGPTTKTYHGISLTVNGHILGRIQSWNTAGAYKREGNHVYELNHQTWGLPVDYVPSRSTGFGIAATVAELWSGEIEVQLGMKAPGDQLANLIQQVKPFTADEWWFRGVSMYRIWRYKGCWLTDRDESDYRADGDARVVTNFSFNYVSRQLLSSGGALTQMGQ
jgi:hypothetical protein